MALIQGCGGTLLHRLSAWVASDKGRPGRASQSKVNAARRHHIPKQNHQVANWAEYDAGLRACGTLTMWFMPKAGVA